MNQDIKSLIFRFADTSSDRAVLAIDADYNIVYANACILSEANLTAAQILGNSLLHDFYGGRKFDQNGNYLSLLIKAVDTGENVSPSVIAPDNLRILPRNYYRSRVMTDKDTNGRTKYAIGVYYVIDREKELESKIGTINFQFVKSLVKALDARDSPTGSHSFTVADIAFRFALHLGLDKKQEREIHLASLVHDIGKIGIPETILNKPGKLTPDEFEIIKKHPVIGCNILDEIESFSSVSAVIRHHHERYDGTGYPDRLSGQSIPLHSRIISLCDAFDAMTSLRVYKAPISPSLACDEIKCQGGKQFDPELAEEFVAFCSSEASQLDL